ncbi:hypothetical protein C8R44DRAFT_806818 [Mycena epipterygia]|nr:hypothetical protein C8R44DRAFT_806818 [Mycena epipterygia]
MPGSAQICSNLPTQSMADEASSEERNYGIRIFEFNLPFSAHICSHPLRLCSDLPYTAQTCPG